MTPPGSPSKEEALKKMKQNFQAKAKRKKAP